MERERDLATLLGAPRTTVDVDVILMLSPQETERGVKLCEQYGFRPGPEAAAKFAFSRRFASLDTVYLEEQVRILMQEAGLSTLMERWRSVKPDEGA